MGHSLAVVALLATAWIDSLGGRIERDANNQVIGVNLRASWVTDGDLLELARLPHLQRLDLSQTRITDQGLAYLKTASNLTEVNLAYAEKIGDPAHAVVKNWKKLRRLSLRGTVIADETARSAASLPELEALDITDTIVGDVGVEALSVAPKLRELSLGNIRMSEVGFQSLRQFTSLHYLDLSGKRPTGTASISQKGMEAIASLTQLRVLRLGHVKFPAKSIPMMLKTLSNLESLSLEYSPEIDDAVLPHLTGWKSLRVIDLYGTKVTADGVRTLREQRPDCQIKME